MSGLPAGHGIVLALGGGGMRGLAHLGVLAEFERAGMEVQALAGTSSGALMGALWMLIGAEPAIGRVKQIVAAERGRELPDLDGSAGRSRHSGVWRRVHQAATLLRMMLAGHPVSGERLVEQMALFLPDIAIETLPKPLVIVATDSTTGEEVRLARGPLRLAVAGSSAMPGLVPPIEWVGRRLQDGGAVAEIPVRAARELGGPVIAVEVSEALPRDEPHSDRIPTALFRAAAIGWQELRRRTLAEADAVIAPAVNHLHWADYGALEEAVEAGRVAARHFLAAAANGFLRGFSASQGRSQSGRAGNGEPRRNG